ncbi:MAG: hypothetical protein HYU66_09305 [Armatimonadetes bacterium]|nr:hypothetical protein [Armatimonadota bacterium]
MRRLAAVVLLAAGWLLGGCAAIPAGVQGALRQLLDLRMTVRGAVDENAYYLFVLDTNGRDSEGPEVIAPLTNFLGNGRATGVYQHYVEYHQGQFELFRDQPEQEGQVVPPRVALGQPFSFDSGSSQGTLRCSLDLNKVEAQGGLKTNAADPDIQQIEINFITVNEIVLPGSLPPTPRQSDGLGTDGTNFITFRVNNGLVIGNTGLEQPGEFFGGQQLDAAYDLVDFRIEIRQGG